MTISVEMPWSMARSPLSLKSFVPYHVLLHQWGIHVVRTNHSPEEGIHYSSPKCNFLLFQIMQAKVFGGTVPMTEFPMSRWIRFNARFSFPFYYRKQKNDPRKAHGLDLVSLISI